MILPLLPTLLLFLSILFLYFILQVKPRRETSQGEPPPHQTAGKVRDGNPLRSASSNTRKGGYGKLSPVDPTEANTGLFHPSFFVLWILTRMPFIFYRPIPYGADRLPTAPLLPRRRPPRPPRIAIRTLNIQDGRGFGMAQAIQAVDRGSFDMMLLTKTKISTTVYCQNRLGYEVNCSSAHPSSAGVYQGGVIIVTRERPVGWGIESTRYHGPNMVIC